jgi:hypothetical protein
MHAHPCISHCAIHLWSQAEQAEWVHHRLLVHAVSAIPPREVEPHANVDPLMPPADLAVVVKRYRMPARGDWRRRPMNIMDPLQHMNNLGRSVSRASQSRIASAMSYVSADMKRLVQDVVCIPAAASRV